MEKWFIDFHACLQSSCLLSAQLLLKPVDDNNSSPTMTVTNKPRKHQCNVSENGNVRTGMIATKYVRSFSFSIREKALILKKA